MSGVRSTPIGASDRPRAVCKSDSLGLLFMPRARPCSSCISAVGCGRKEGLFRHCRLQKAFLTHTPFDYHDVKIKHDSKGKLQREQSEKAIRDEIFWGCVPSHRLTVGTRESLSSSIGRPIATLDDAPLPRPAPDVRRRHGCARFHTRQVSTRAPIAHRPLCVPPVAAAHRLRHPVAPWKATFQNRTTRLTSVLPPAPVIAG